MERVGLCQTCGVAFEVKSGTVGKYCSHKCSYARKGNRGQCGRPGQPKVHRHCPVCGAGFVAFASRIRGGRDIYCSRECFNRSRTMAQTKRPCDHCRKVELVAPYKQHRRRYFCSKECFYQHKRLGQWVKCGNEACFHEVYQLKSVQPGRNRRRYCSRACFKAVYHGPSHHLWEHGLCGHDLRHGYEFTRSQRRAILERDGYACKACGDDQAEILHVDHILAICLGGTGDIENGQTLCARCHNKKTACDRAVKKQRKVSGGDGPQ
jgi:hypothetical protein